MRHYEEDDVSCATGLMNIAGCKYILRKLDTGQIFRIDMILVYYICKLSSIHLHEFLGK